MTLFDYLVLAAIAASVFLGAWRGVASELLSLAAWVLAFFAARGFGPLAADWLKGAASDGLVRLCVGYAAVFLSVLVLVALARLLMRELLRAVGLGPLDRLLGALFGVLRGVVVALVGVLLGGMTPLPREAWWRDAVLAPPLETAVVAGKPWLPAEVAKRIRYR